MSYQYFVAKQRLEFPREPKAKPGESVVVGSGQLFVPLLEQGVEIMSIDVEGDYAYAACRKAEIRKAGSKV